MEIEKSIETIGRQEADYRSYNDSLLLNPINIFIFQYI